MHSIRIGALFVWRIRITPNQRLPLHNRIVCLSYTVCMGWYGLPFMGREYQMVDPTTRWITIHICLLS